MNEESEKGFKLIKKFVEDYPKSEYPQVDNDLLETFCRGARLLGIKYIVLPEDDDICPECGGINGKVGKNISLKTAFSMSTICHWCYVEMEQDDIIHDTETCDHPVRGKDVCTKRDCMAVLEAFENSYKAILKEEGWD